MKKVLTVAGSDCSGGAGIQADLKTMTALGVYGMSVVTSLTAQNTTGVCAIYDASPEFVEQQFDAVFSDIRPDALKIGMLSNAEIIRVVAQKLTEYKACNIVADPVMVSTSGCRLLVSDAERSLTDLILPSALLITPNIPEAEILCGLKIASKDDMLNAAEILVRSNGTNVLLKGGHLDGKSDDLLYTAKGGVYWFEAEKIDNPNTHGTGCTLSSAIACGLAKGLELRESVQTAKEYVSGALSARLNLGKGNGPLNHCWKMN
ncbi:MAG: bifunctional hydroxymethylpyrimidine kinase/phosphomethylpyrimidine kinase [Synergistaceae bacterium]|nr:bifunctional hydroxymethylpyrimidine kinase/phosphomethylpyrimidine kinase [Synergistaceae bacterium]